MKYIDLLILALALLLSTNSRSQELDSPIRPKIGVALSGGSAHGLAHIGVLKYLEELGIEVDYVTGTSMGSIIGGLYAIGFDANEIRGIAADLDWDVIMSNGIPLREVAPIEKHFHDKSPFSILWKDNSFKLPQGLIRGQKLDQVISKVYCPAHEVNDFDDLHIPFRCVGVDIEDGSVDVFNRGYIGNAIRASMAIPTVFPPKEVDGTLYVDGGLSRNFPVQEAFDLGADYVIGVYVGSEKESRDKLVSMLDILRQASTMSSLLDSERQKELADLVILPNIKNLGSFDFDSYDAFIELGYEAARANAEPLKNLAKKLSQYPAPERNKKLSYPTSLRFHKVSIPKAEPVFEKMILNRLGVWENYAVSLEDIDEGLSDLYGTKNFSKIAYSLDRSAEGLELKIDVEEVPPFSMGFNVNRFDLYNTALVLSAEARNILGRPSNLRMDARISDNPGIQGAYYIRLPRHPQTLFRLSGKAEMFELPQYDAVMLDQIFRYNQSFVQAELINEWKGQYLFSAGYRFVHNDLKPSISGRTIFNNYQSERNELFVGFNRNTLDKEVYATSGMLFNFETRYVFNNIIQQTSQGEPELPFFEDDKAYFGIDVSFKRYQSLGEKVNFTSALRARYATGNSFLDSYRVGGPEQQKRYTYGFVGVEDSELVLGNHFSAAIGLRLALRSNLFLTPTVQFVYGDRFNFVDIKEVSVLGLGTALSYNSPIGPISVDFGYSDLNDRVVINLGIGYRHIL